MIVLNYRIPEISGICWNFRYPYSKKDLEISTWYFETFRSCDLILC